MGGRLMTDYYWAEARRYLPDRAKTRGRNYEAELRQSGRDRGKTVYSRGKAKPAKKTASRPPRAEADASRTTSLFSPTLHLHCVFCWQ